MGERQRSDLELGHLLGHLLLDAQRRGSIPELLRKEVRVDGAGARWGRGIEDFLLEDVGRILDLSIRKRFVSLML